MTVVSAMRTLRVTVYLLGLLLFGAGCKTTYYQAWEKLGKHKRDLLKENVEQARDDQANAAQTFKDALTRLKELYRFEGGNLEKTYDKLKSDYDRCQARADTVKSRIAKVQEIASDLFQEWEAEIKTMENSNLASSSRQTLRETQSKFQSLQAAMKQAERSMEPVLRQFRDQVTYLKHNLNAQAVGALKGEALDIEKEVQQLIRDMNASISEADSFIRGMQTTS